MPPSNQHRCLDVGRMRALFSGSMERVLSPGSNVVQLMHRDGKMGWRRKKGRCAPRYAWRIWIWIFGGSMALALCVI